MLNSRPTLSRMVPYVPGKSIAQVLPLVEVELPILKLASNETPLGCPIQLSELAPYFETIHHYPGELPAALRERLARHWGISDAHFVLGNGSDEVIGFVAMAYLNPGEQVISSACTFSEYRFATYLLNGDYREIPLCSDWHHDLDGILGAITPQTRLIYLANPNNPTGLTIPVAELDSFLARVPASVMVILDEAYGEFVPQGELLNPVALIQKHSNVVVLRTFSKLYGMAGFRVGYAIAAPEVCHELRKVAAPFNVNSLALAAARLALDKTDFVSESLRLNALGRAYFYAQLDEMGLDYLKSGANFVCIFTDIEASILTAALIKQGIIVRGLTSFGIHDGIRVTIGLPDQNERFFKTFKLILKRISG